MIEKINPGNLINHENRDSESDNRSHDKKNIEMYDDRINVRQILSQQNQYRKSS